MWRYIDVSMSSVDLGVIWGTEISIFWYPGSGKTWLKCSKFPESACSQASERCGFRKHSAGEKREGRVREGEIWDSIPVSWGQIFSKDCLRRPKDCPKGALKKHTENMFKKGIEKKDRMGAN